MSYEETHQQALRDYGIEYSRGYENKLYTNEALKAGDEAFRKGTQ